MATKCCLSRKLQVRGNTVSMLDSLDKAEPRMQDTKPVSEGQSNKPVRNTVPTISSMGPSRS